MRKITHFEIPCDDLNRATGFYSSVFGWRIMEIPDMQYVMAYTVDVDDETQAPSEPGAINGGFYSRSAHASRSPVLVIDVDDIEAAMSAVQEAGGTVRGEIHKVGDMGRYVQFADPEGNILGLWQSLHGGS